VHVFPTEKYRLVAARVARAGLVPAGFVEPVPASWDELALVHTPAYLDALAHGTLTPDDLARLEIPCSPAIVEGFRLMTGGTITAARLALDGRDRVAVHIGGGFHHAFAGHGEGFCMFNDVAVAIREAQRARRAVRAAVVDLDVHHGNGTASIFAGDPRVFTLSVHDQANYPPVKPAGSLDIGLARGSGDADYLGGLDGALTRVLEHLPDVLFYLAGADPYSDDQLGGLAVSQAGLRRRDRLVFEAGRSAGVPIVVVLAGGYARHLDDTVAIHAATVEEAARA
jgi:acetoin utilization deacetylase AcuC-like enzyme